ncbi:MAG: hypothetical protein FJ056_06995 [Cyanobacteria bacterium M_surface_10_m2_179]|nr:hypothetical protein [Cyanobacteria bacterium M_surface_10_m2_179]
MAVASPYAVFRAADLGWPGVVDRPLAEAIHHTTPPAPRKRARPFNTLIQGELFPEGALSI